MKLWTLILLLGAAPSLSFAQANNEGLEKIKAEMLKNMDRRIAIIQETKSCVQGASNHPAIQQCHQGQAKKMEQMKAENQARRQEFKQHRQQRRQERQQQQHQQNQSGSPG